MAASGLGLGALALGDDALAVRAAELARELVDDEGDHDDGRRRQQPTAQLTDVEAPGGERDARADEPEDREHGLERGLAQAEVDGVRGDPQEEEGEAGRRRAREDAARDRQQRAQGDHRLQHPERREVEASPAHPDTEHLGQDADAHEGQRPRGVVGQQQPDLPQRPLDEEEHAERPRDMAAIMRGIHRIHEYAGRPPHVLGLLIGSSSAELERGPYDPSHARVAQLVEAATLKVAARESVRVRIPPRAWLMRAL
jgi:hypothetical protein